MSTLRGSVDEHGNYHAPMTFANMETLRANRIDPSIEPGGGEALPPLAVWGWADGSAHERASIGLTMIASVSGFDTSSYSKATWAISIIEMLIPGFARTNLSGRNRVTVTQMSPAQIRYLTFGTWVTNIGTPEAPIEQVNCVPTQAAGPGQVAASPEETLLFFSHNFPATPMMLPVYYPAATNLHLAAHVSILLYSITKPPRGPDDDQYDTKRPAAAAASIGLPPFTGTMKMPVIVYEQFNSIFAHSPALRIGVTRAFCNIIASGTSDLVKMIAISQVSSWRDHQLGSMKHVAEMMLRYGGAIRRVRYLQPAIANFDDHIRRYNLIARGGLGREADPLVDFRNLIYHRRSDVLSTPPYTDLVLLMRDYKLAQSTGDERARWANYAIGSPANLIYEDELRAAGEAAGITIPDRRVTGQTSVVDSTLPPLPPT